VVVVILVVIGVDDELDDEDAEVLLVIELLVVD
jgi:hypothetical protein